jgi:hypothetical protein|nr:MAG TPA: hypothetical protein [Caudoviricetes sp.]
MQEPSIQDLLKPNFTFGTFFKVDGEQDIVIVDSANRMVSLSVTEAYNLLKYLSQVIKVEEGENNEQGNTTKLD